MNKKKAIERFKNHELAMLKDIERHGPDYDLRHQAWGDYTDYLCRCQEITLKQYETWSVPDCFRKVVTNG